jgi:hypothetical protein
MASPLSVKLGGGHAEIPGIVSYGLTALIAVHVVAFFVWVVLAIRSSSKRKPTKAD